MLKRPRLIENEGFFPHANILLVMSYLKGKDLIFIISVVFFNFVVGLTGFAKFALISSNAITFSVSTMSMSVAVWNFTFIMPQLTFFTLPTRVTLAFTVDVFAALTAQNWTNTCTRNIHHADVQLGNSMSRKFTNEFQFFLL